MIEHFLEKEHFLIMCHSQDTVGRGGGEDFCTFDQVTSVQRRRTYLWDEYNIFYRTYNLKDFGKKNPQIYFERKGIKTQFQC